MTLREILNAAYDDQGYQISGVVSPNPSADVIARFTRWTNEGLQDLLGRPRLGPLRHASLAFETFVGRAVYSISTSFDAIDAIRLPAHDRRLRAMTRDAWLSLDPGERSTGTPTAWIEETYAAVAWQPPLSELWVQARSPADNTQTVKIEAVFANGFTHGGSGTLQGTTRVKIQAAPWIFVRSFTVDPPASDIVELWSGGPLDPDARVLGEINIGQASQQYHHIRLWPTPSEHLSVLVDGQLTIQPLVSPADTPIQIPVLYHTALVDYVNYRAYEKNGDSARAQVSRANYERRLNDLTNKVEFSADFRPVRGGLGPDARRWTNLPGGYFPADGWGR